MSVIALSSCAAAPFAQRPTSAANRYVLIVYCCASLLRVSNRAVLGLAESLARSIDALAGWTAFRTGRRTALRGS